MNNIVVFAGGVGGAKLAYGLAKVVPSERLTIIVNTGDDFWLHGLRICPDLDTIMYTLSELVDKNNGWGVANDTTHMLHMLERYGEEIWFRLGDKDLATHLLRTQRLHDGQTLTEVTRFLSTMLGIQPWILPMSDSPIATRVKTIEHGELDFQTYFVKFRWQPTVTSLCFAGLADAVITQDVEQALAQADIILIGPSNPWLSIDPILSVPGMREAVVARDVPRVALTPIIQGAAMKGPAAKIMAELGYEQSAKAVAEHYGDVINGFVYDERDASLNIQHVRTVTLNTVMEKDLDRVRLADEILNWIKEWN